MTGEQNASELLSVVIPVYKTAWALPELADRLARIARERGLGLEIVVVDDASPDEVAEVVSRLQAEHGELRLVRLPENRGQNRAVMAGLAVARGDWVAVLDGDLQDPPEALPALMARAKEGHDAVFAARLGQYQGLGRMITSRVFKVLMHDLAGLPQGAGLYVLTSRRIVQRLLQCPDDDPRVVPAIAFAGLSTSAVPVARNHRHEGASAYSGLSRARVATAAVMFALRWRWRGRRAPADQAAWASDGEGGGRSGGSGPVRGWFGRLAAVAGVAVLAPALLLTMTDLAAGPVVDRAAIGLPLTYHGDELYGLALVKNVIETGDWRRNPRLGAPDGQVHLDFASPGQAWFSLWLIRGIGLQTQNPFLAANLFRLATFALVAATAFVFFAWLGVRPSLATAGAVLYALLPFHTQRMGHLLLMGYYGVPVALMLALWLMRPQPGGRPRPSLLLTLLVVVVLLPLLAGTSVYYSFFNAFFLVVAGAVGAITERDPRRLLIGVGSAMVIALAVATMLLPSWRYTRVEGVNEVILNRSHAETEVYPLKLAHLVLPVSGHRVEGLDRLTRRYLQSPLNNENRTAALGFLGASGALILLLWSVVAPLARSVRETGLGRRMSELAALFLAGFLLGVMGGVGSLFGLLVSPTIRAYNRVSLYLALLAFAAVLLLVERACRQRFAARRPLLVAAASLTIFVPALLDLVPAGLYRRPEHRMKRFARDSEFVAQLEARHPGARTVFQLPYRDYPEGGQGSYQQLIPYLHSATFRWSAAALKGRPQAERLRRLAELPAEELVPALRAAGFDAVLVDRHAYPQRAEELAEGLGAVLAAAPVKSWDWLFFDLEPRDHSATILPEGGAAAR